MPHAPAATPIAPGLSRRRRHPKFCYAALRRAATRYRNSSLLVITSFSGHTKTSWAANRSGVQQAYAAAWKAYLSSVGQTRAVKLQIKAVDNSAAGVGVHARVFFGNNDNSACAALATKLLSTAPADNDYSEQYMSTAIFNATANPDFGIITRRSAMRACKKWNPPSGTTSITWP